MEQQNKPEVLLLLSGGIDSAALLHFYKTHNVIMGCIHYNYNQPSMESELKAAEKICGHYSTNLRLLDLSIPMAYSEDEVLCRNAIFVLAAASLGYHPIRIALGIHANSQYYDSTPRFVDDCQNLLDGYFGGVVRVEAPFIEYTKADIIAYSKEHNLPLELTYSCLRRSSPPCGVCPSCLDRRAFIENK
jgi:7-cyano-7-deazaguanine synthase